MKKMYLFCKLLIWLEEMEIYMEKMSIFEGYKINKLH